MPDQEQYGLECKHFWCKKILSGEKTVELRQYDLPPELIGRRIWLLASGGKDGVAALGDEVPATSPDAIVVGWVQFSGIKEYHTVSEWAADVDLHQVPLGSPYGWREGETSVIYGWQIEKAESLVKPRVMVPAMRVKRSLYLLLSDPATGQLA